VALSVLLSLLELPDAALALPALTAPFVTGVLPEADAACVDDDGVDDPDAVADDDPAMVTGMAEVSR
jgi:hypothetical protein